MTEVQANKIIELLSAIKQSIDNLDSKLSKDHTKNMEELITHVGHIAEHI